MLVIHLGGSEGGHNDSMLTGVFINVFCSGLQLRLKKKAVGRNDRGQPNQRTAKVSVHVNSDVGVLLSCLPAM